jgi:uncharacterized repeat protein (TIGR03837 family)
MRWSLFCRVIDNHGDAGFCLRLARELVARGETVQLFIDDASALRWMQADARIEPLPWPGEAEQPALGEVLIEAFGCELPSGVQRVAARDRPLWINLEYLSAESYVERSHGLPSPVLSGPAGGCVKRFCYPGFTARTGGLLRERGLQPAWQAHDAQAWWRERGLAALPDERQVSLFAYPGAPLDELLSALADAPTRLLVCGGLLLPSQHPLPAGLRVQILPWLSQADYDRLLWSCDLNLVRGEDSFVRAQWAGRPMLWHIYEQDDDAHRAKLAAFLDLYGGPRSDWLRWNGLAEPPLDLKALFGSEARRRASAWRDRLLQGPELADTLQAWAMGKSQ